ncbi:MAG: SHOCT domain-containing protein [Clostridiaceae bacterium]|nr:SHOCT domain-containing protein [Clostridiaceae bacterium]
MSHGRGMGYGFYGSYILSVLIIFIIISLIVYFLYKRRESLYFEKSIEVLKERYVREEISAEEFREKRSVIEGLEVSDSAVVSLVDRYVKGEIDSEKFFVILEQIKK